MNAHGGAGPQSVLLSAIMPASYRLTLRGSVTP